MDQQIYQILSIHKNIPFKAQIFCEKLISQNFHQFFDALIAKIDRIAKSLPQIDKNSGKSEQETLKRLIFILNRELSKIIRNLSKEEQEKISQIWSIINSILMHPNLSFISFKKMIPSIQAFLSQCNEEEIKYIFIHNSSKNQNPQAQIILIYALIESKTSIKIICKITTKIFQQFQKDLIPNLKQLLQALENMNQELSAVDMVCNLVKRWSRYQNIFLRLLHISKQQSSTFDEVMDMVNSREFLKTIKIFLEIDEHLLLKKSTRKDKGKICAKEQVQDFRLLLKSKYNKVNKRINCLKAQTFKGNLTISLVLNFIVQIISKFQTNETIKYWNQFIGFVSNQLLPQIVFDLYLLGKSDPEEPQNDSLTANTFELIQSLIVVLSSLAQMDLFRKIILQAINDTASEKEFIFFGCICNIERFEQKHFPNRASLLEESLTLKVSQKNNHFFVSNFMNKILPLMNFDEQFMVDFAAQISTFMLDESISISEVSQSMGISEEIEYRIQKQNLSLYLHILQSTTKLEYLRNYGKQLNTNLFRVIEFGVQDFEKFSVILKTQFLSICLHVSHLWISEGLTKNMSKLINDIIKCLGEQNEETKLLLQFCYSAIIHLAFEDIELIKKRQKKNSHLIIQFYQCLVKCFKATKLNQNHYVCNILSCLVINDIWSHDRSAFDGNFIILEVCYTKVYNLENLLENTSNVSDKEIQSLLPKEEFITLISNCVLSLQMSFDSNDHDMQIKMSSMRQMIIQMFAFFTHFTNLFAKNQITELSSVIQVITGTHLLDKVSPDLCLIIKNDDYLVNVLVKFLCNVDQICRSYLPCVCNIIVSLQGNISTDFLMQVFTKIKDSLCRIQTSDIDQFLLKEILYFVNVIFLYNINQSIQSEDFIEICKEILRITGKHEGISNQTLFRQSQRVLINTSDFTHIKIKLLIMKFFILSAKSQPEQHLNFKSIGMKKKKFSSLASQFKSLKKKISLEDLTFFLYAIENCIRETRDEVQKEFIFELGLQFSSLKHKKLQIPSYLKRRFDPIAKIKNMIIDLTKRIQSDLTSENLKMVEKLLDELDGFEIRIETPRKIISIRKQKCVQSMKKSYQNQDEDVII